LKLLHCTLFHVWSGLKPGPARGKTSESVHCTILNKLCAFQRMRHRPSARSLYRFGRLARPGPLALNAAQPGLERGTHRIT